MSTNGLQLVWQIFACFHPWTMSRATRAVSLQKSPESIVIENGWCSVNLQYIRLSESVLGKSDLCLKILLYWNATFPSNGNRYHINWKSSQVSALPSNFRMSMTAWLKCLFKTCYRGSWVLSMQLKSVKAKESFYSDIVAFSSFLKRVLSLLKVDRHQKQYAKLVILT